MVKTFISKWLPIVTNKQAGIRWIARQWRTLKSDHFKEKEEEKKLDIVSQLSGNSVEKPKLNFNSEKNKRKKNRNSIIVAAVDGMRK